MGTGVVRFAMPVAVRCQAVLPTAQVSIALMSDRVTGERNEPLSFFWNLWRRNFFLHRGVGANWKHLPKPVAPDGACGRCGESRRPVLADIAERYYVLIRRSIQPENRVTQDAPPVHDARLVSDLISTSRSRISPSQSRSPARKSSIGVLLPPLGYNKALRQRCRRPLFLRSAQLRCLAYGFPRRHKWVQSRGVERELLPGEDFPKENARVLRRAILHGRSQLHVSPDPQRENCLDVGRASSSIVSIRAESLAGHHAFQTAAERREGDGRLSQRRFSVARAPRADLVSDAADVSKRMFRGWRPS